MIVKLYRAILGLRDSIKLLTIKRIIAKRSIICGGGQKYTLKSRVNLLNGAKPSNVIIENAVYLEGIINVSDNGTVILKEHSRLGPNSEILCVDKVVIGAYTNIANYVTICDNNNHPINPLFRKYMRLCDRNDDANKWRHSKHTPIIVGENCWIGTRVRICKGVTIGDNSIVAANSVVTKDVPANCIVAGNPAKVVKTNIQDIPAPASCEGFNRWLKEQNL